MYHHWWKGKPCSIYIHEHCRPTGFLCWLYLKGLPPLLSYDIFNNWAMFGAMFIHIIDAMWFSNTKLSQYILIFIEPTYNITVFGCISPLPAYVHRRFFLQSWPPDLEQIKMNFHMNEIVIKLFYWLTSKYHLMKWYSHDFPAFPIRSWCVVVFLILFHLQYCQTMDLTSWKSNGKPW